MWSTDASTAIMSTADSMNCGSPAMIFFLSFMYVGPRTLYGVALPVRHDASSREWESGCTGPLWVGGAETGIIREVTIRAMHTVWCALPEQQDWRRMQSKGGPGRGAMGL